MSEKEAPYGPKRLSFYPSNVVANAFNKFMESDGFVSESKALEFIAREALIARGLLSVPKKPQA